MLLSWAAGKPVIGPMQTFAEGVATRVPFENTQRIMRQHLDDFVMVPDQAKRPQSFCCLNTLTTWPKGQAQFRWPQRFNSRRDWPANRLSSS